MSKKYLPQNGMITNMYVGMKVKENTFCLSVFMGSWQAAAVASVGKKEADSVKKKGSAYALTLL